MLLYTFLFPVVFAAESDWDFGNYIIRTNENNTLTNIEKNPNATVLELNLSNLGLKNIDLNIFKNVTTIKRLNLTNNWLSTLPNYAFANLTNLTDLSLADNNITAFDRTFIGLDQLTTLDISNNPLKIIGDSYFYGLNKFVDITTKGIALTNVSTFLFEVPYQPRPKYILRANKNIEESNKLDESFTRVKVCMEGRRILKVEVYQAGENVSICTVTTVDNNDLKLSLESLSINNFDKGWYQIKNLPVRSLDLAYNKILNITSELLNDLPENIVEVDLSNNLIDSLKPEIIENWHLRSLILDDDYIDKIYEDALAKTNLSILSLNNNFLKNTTFLQILPSSIIDLRLSNNEISKLPNGSIPSLKNLSKLDLSSNNLTIIEAEFFQNFPILRELNLYNNTVNLYKGIFQGLAKIEYLNIGMNKLGNVTKDTLFALPDTLDTVILDSNEIKSLAFGIFVRIPKHKLSLERNNMTKIEKGTFNLPSLEELCLGKNQLTQITSASFKGLANLRRLSLAENNMTKLERGILQYMSNLEILDISLNPIKELTRGALNGMVNSQKGAVLLSGVPIEYIQGTIFDST